MRTETLKRNITDLTQKEAKQRGITLILPSKEKKKNFDNGVQVGYNMAITDLMGMKRKERTIENLLSKRNKKFNI